MSPSPNPPSPDDGSGSLQIKGSTLLSKLGFLNERFGEQAAAAASAFLAENGVRQPLSGSWYSFELFDGLLRHIAEKQFGGDLTRLAEVGVFSAEQAFGTTYEAYVQKDFASFLRLIGVLHGRFYSAGELAAEMDADQSSCRIRMFGAPYYTEPDLYVAQGFYIGAARIMGLRDVECHFSISDGEVSFDLHWLMGDASGTVEAPL